VSWCDIKRACNFNQRDGGCTIRVTGSDDRDVGAAVLVPCGEVVERDSYWWWWWWLDRAQSVVYPDESSPPPSVPFSHCILSSAIQPPPWLLFGPPPPLMWRGTREIRMVFCYENCDGRMLVPVDINIRVDAWFIWWVGGWRMTNVSDTCSPKPSDISAALCTRYRNRQQ
jgi:hypothetical protein